MKNKKLAVNMTVYFVANMIVNVLFYVYQLLMSKVLSVTEYGLLNSVMSFYTIIAIPMSAISFFVSRHISLYFEQGSEENINSFRHSMIKNINKFFPALYILLILFIPLFSQILKVYNNYLYFIIPIFTAIIYSYITFFKAVIYGQRKFNLYSSLSIAELLFRIIGSLSFVYIGWSYIGGFLGVLLGGISNLALIYLYDKRQFIFTAPETHSVDYSEIKSFVLPSLCLTIVTVLLSNIDIILAKIFLSDFDLGIYSTVSVLAKIIIAVLNIYITFGQTYFVDTKKNIKIITFIYAIFIFSGLFAIGFFYIFPTFLVHMLFGDRYILAANYLGTISVIAFLFSLISLLLSHMLSSGKSKTSYIALIGMIILPIIFLFNKTISIKDFINNMLIFYIIYSIYFLCYLFYTKITSGKKSFLN